MASESTLILPSLSLVEEPLWLNMVGNYYYPHVYRYSSFLFGLALQLAKISGFSPIITTASLKHKDALLELGATHVLDRTLTDDQIKKQIADIAKKPVQHTFDTVSGAATQQLALDVLGANGTTAFVLPADKDLKITDGKKISQAYAGLQSPQNVELLQTLYHDSIYGWLEQGLIIVSLQSIA